MYNLSFCAKLNIDNNLYTKIPEGTPEGYIDNLVDNYKQFVQHPKINQILGEDVIELKKARHPSGYAVELSFLNSDTGEKIVGGVYTNKKIPSISPYELIRQTCQYIGFKYDIKMKFSENSFTYPKRALKEVLEKFQSD